ncbi:MAG: Mg2+/Co2+ transporter CorB [Planctomycetota bacterium]|jgi:Mg2+/Co2+ transporter CorB
MEKLTWLGVVVCLLHSATFSGLNLALLGLGRSQLEADAEGGNPAASRVHALLKDPNLLLTTIL